MLLVARRNSLECAAVRRQDLEEPSAFISSDNYRTLTVGLVSCFGNFGSLLFETTAATGVSGRTLDGLGGHKLFSFVYKSF
jgi:hypothetical protein